MKVLRSSCSYLEVAVFIFSFHSKSISVRVRLTCRTECTYMYCLSMIPIKTIVIEQVRRDISSVKQAYVKLACNRVISPGISHIACESVETAIRTFMFGCLFSIFHHAIKNVSLIENTDQTFSL